MISDRGCKKILWLGALTLTTLFKLISVSHASTIRVESLDMVGLMPDEEADLDFNPARLASINGDRLFTGLTVNLRNESNESSLNGSTFYRSNSVDMYGEYVSIKKPVRWSFKYLPSVSKDKSNSFSGSEKSLHTSRVSVGIPLRESSTLGINLGVDGTDGELRGTGAASGRVDSIRDNSLSATIGLLEGDSDQGQWGLVMFGTKGKTDDREEAPTSSEVSESDYYNYGIRFLPERRLSDSTLFRGLAEVSYYKNETENTYSWPETHYNEFYKLLTILGATGWSVERKNGDIWTLRISGSLMDFSEKYGDATTMTIDSFSSWGDLAIGCEHAIVPSRLLLRASLAPLYASYHRSTYDRPSFPLTNKNWAVRLSGSNATIGLGWTISQEWIADFNLNSISGNYQDAYAHHNSEISSSNGSNVSVRGSATYRF